MADTPPSLVQFNPTKDVPTGALQRLDMIATEMGQLRNRMNKLLAKVDGMSEPPPATETVPLKGMKGALDKIESDLRGIARPMGALEELF